MFVIQRRSSCLVGSSTSFIHVIAKYVILISLSRAETRTINVLHAQCRALRDQSNKKSPVAPLEPSLHIQLYIQHTGLEFGGKAGFFNLLSTYDLVDTSRLRSFGAQDTTVLQFYPRNTSAGLQNVRNR